MEALLQQLLEGQKRMDERFDKMDECFDRMDERFDKVDQRLDKVEARLDKVETRLDKMDERLEGVEVQLSENTDMVKALTHRVEVLGAEQQGLLIKTASVEMVEKIDERLDAIEANMATKQDINKIVETQKIHTEWLKNLSAKSFQHEAEIDYLKLAK